jgi:putative hydrolase of the HAD superfamily
LIKLVVFDIGGTIIDFGESIYYRYLSGKLCLPESRIRKVFDKLITESEYDRITTSQMLKTAARELDVPVSDLDWGIFKKLARINPDTTNIMRELNKRYKVVLLSNIGRSRFQETAMHFLDKNMYSHAFVSYALKMRKPDRRIYEYVLKKMGVKANEAIFIDDLMANIRGARKIGMAGIWFTNAKELKKRLNGYGVYIGK